MKQFLLFEKKFIILNTILCFLALGKIMAMTQLTHLDRQSFYLITHKKPVAQLVQLKPQVHLQTDKKSSPVITDMSLTTTSGISFSARFFDNHQNRVIVLGQGFLRDMNIMQDFVHLLGPDFDYIMFDYRWKNITSYLFNFSTCIRPLQRIFYDEQEEVLAVTRFLKSKKQYKETIGLGQCYSSFLFMMTQAQEQQKGNQLFSRLILDGCWYSLREFAAHVDKDPWLIANPQRGRPFWLRQLCAPHALQGAIKTLTHCMSDVVIKPYAEQIKNTPILFIHGMNDLLISIESFSRVWHAVQVPKSVLLTPHRHADNRQSDGMMIQACKTFLQSSSVEDFALKMKQ